MFTEALNAPWVLIILYGILSVATALNMAAWLRLWNRSYTGRNIMFLILAAALIGAGLALLGAAYLHDVWYC